jgi:hypothetical protein
MALCHYMFAHTQPDIIHPPDCLHAKGLHGRCICTFPHADLHVLWHRTLGWHQAEELLLRAVVAPAAERLVAFGGLDEPLYPDWVAEGGSRRRPWWLLKLDVEQCVSIASVMVSNSLQVGFCMRNATARTPRSVGRSTCMLQ